MEYTLTPAHVHRWAVDVLVRHLRLTDTGRACPARTLLALLFAAAARLTSLFAAANGTRTGPSAETARKALLANLPADLAVLERRLNRALHATAPRRLARRHRLAIDLTLIPYHGTHHTSADELCRGQAKSGTTHFHAYATAYLVHRGQRVTLALTSVRHGEDLAVVVRRLLRTARAAGARPQVLLLDRGFYAVSVIRYLQSSRTPFLMPVPIRGRAADHPAGPGGTRVFSTWRRSGFGEHVVRSGSRTARVRIAVHVRNRAGRRGRRGRERLVYAFWGWTPPTPGRVSQVYRERFGIETSYRQMNQGRVRTCTRNPSVRLLLVGIGLVLRNVWVWLHWEVLAERGRGPRRVRLDLLTLKGLLLMLHQVAVEQFGFRDGIPSQRPLPDELPATPEE